MRQEREEAVLRWTCETCGWTCDVPMPGHAGTSDGLHYRGSEESGRCGPLVARHAGYRARPGATGRELERLAAQHGVPA